MGHKVYVVVAGLWGGKEANICNQYYEQADHKLLVSCQVPSSGGIGDTFGSNVGRRKRTGSLEAKRREGARRHARLIVAEMVSEVRSWLLMSSGHAGGQTLKTEHFTQDRGRSHSKAPSKGMFALEQALQ